MAATQHEGFNLSFVMNFSGSYNCLFPDIFKKFAFLGCRKTKLFIAHTSGDVLRPHSVKTVQCGPNVLQFLLGLQVREKQ